MTVDGRKRKCPIEVKENKDNCFCWLQTAMPKLSLPLKFLWWISVTQKPKLDLQTWQSSKSTENMTGVSGKEETKFLMVHKANGIHKQTTSTKKPADGNTIRYDTLSNEQPERVTVMIIDLPRLLHSVTAVGLKTHPKFWKSALYKINIIHKICCDCTIKRLKTQQI